MLRLAGVKSYSTASSLTSQSDGSQWPRFGLLLRRAAADRPRGGSTASRSRGQPQSPLEAVCQVCHFCT